ncbi:sensor histidine kinase [Pseudoalteromonas sp. SR44-8]|uniref:sensor histidine kinase n=1 Tax=Pseudoalteromonas sp. SR44-8 TaxID=2760933 RepID=UPI0015FF2299|nr:HAMP domain-containing sensor histidine kinase [Pseudoalteromonas sp. SR44-8]MBB1303672.1 sensor histidine kinase [Pseudoalteromonas sp. SR44-8]
MTKKNNLFYSDKKAVLIKLLFILFVAMLIGWLVYEQVYQSKVTIIKERQDEKLVLVSTDLSKELSSIKKLTQLLANGQVLKSNTDLNTLSAQKSDKLINDYFLNFASVSTNISQIRWLERSGKERYRINFSNKKSEIVEVSQLQNKQNRYYFKEGMLVAPPNTFISEIDLNVERGKVVIPHEPTIRVTYRTPADDYLIDGLLVVNFNLNYLFSNIRQYDEKNTQVNILNHDGYWLYNKDPALQFGFMYNQVNNSLANNSPALWQHIIEHDVQSTSRIFHDSLYTFRRFSIVSLREATHRTADSDKEIIILIGSPKELLYNAKMTAFQYAALCSIVLCIVGFGFSYREYLFQQQLITLSYKLQREKIELDSVNKQLDLTIRQQQQLQASLLEAQKLSSLGLLVAGVAHEMNTPIGGAIISVSNADVAINKLNEAMKAGLTKSQLDKSTQSIEENLGLAKVNLNKAAVLVKSFKKMAIDRHNDDVITCNIRKITEDLLITLNSRLKNSNIKVKTLVETEQDIKSRPGIISQVLENLIMNALTHGFAKNQVGEIEIKIEQAASQSIKLTISDSGVGIKEDSQQFIFEPFYTSARGIGNTGLGLYMVHQWVTQILQGEIKLQSNPHSVERFKTQFIIIIPNIIK